jgi:hypothetical protein
MKKIGVLLFCLGCSYKYSELSGTGADDAGGPVDSGLPVEVAPAEYAPMVSSGGAGGGRGPGSGGVSGNGGRAGMSGAGAGTGGAGITGTAGTGGGPGAAGALGSGGTPGLGGSGAGRGGSGDTGSAGHGGSPGAAGRAGATGGAGVAGGSGGLGGSGFGGAAGRSGCVPTTEVCDGLDNNCNGLTDESPACPTGCTGFALSGHGYMYCSPIGDVIAAKLRCFKQNMHLAWIESAAENAALATAVPAIANRPYNGGNQAGPYIGGTDVVKEGTFVWGDGTVFWTGGLMGSPAGTAFYNWAHDEPNDNGTAAEGGEDCIEFLLEDGTIGLKGQWNDVPCSNPIYETLCESY